MSEYKPHAWVIIHFKTEDAEVYKVMGGWRGGYLYGDSWRLNSGIKEVRDNGDAYEFTGISGSVYICNKLDERMSGLMSMVYNSWENVIKGKDSLKIIKTYKFIKVVM